MDISPIYATYDWSNYPHTSPFKYCPMCGESLELVEFSDRQRPTCSRCGFIHFRNPSPGIAVLVIDGEKVLLGKRSGDLEPGKWAIPSGYIEFDEDFLTAARREVKEETGLDIQICSIIHVESAFLSPRNHFFTAYMLGRVTGGKLRAGDDIEAVEWFPISGPLPKMAFQPDIDLIQTYARTRYEGLFTKISQAT